MVQKMGGKAVEIFSDSRLVVGQVQGKLEVRDPRMQEYLSQVRHLQSKFESFLLSQVPRSRNAHLDSLATLATSSAQSLPQVILVEDLCKPSEVGRNVVHVHRIRVGLVGWTLLCYSLRKMSCLKVSLRPTRYEEKLLSFGCLWTKSCIKDHSLARTCYAYILKQLSCFWKNYMKGFGKATQGADLCLTKPSQKVIDGRICKKKHSYM